MAFTTDVQICNLALAKMGDEGAGITAAQLTTPDDEPSRKCDLLFEPTRDAMMSAFPWKFALKRVEFDSDDYEITITSITPGDPAVVTATAHGILAGQCVYIWDTNQDDFNDTIYYVYDVDTDTITLYKRDQITSLDASAYFFLQVVQT